MNGRVAAIDLLRGLAIVGMVLSGQMLWNAGLPAAMFHAQLPPPSFAFDPSVPGITWVDLVFPFFLFSMGAALPFALRRREAQGARTRDILQSALHRWLWLVLFAVVLANTYMARLHNIPAWAAALATLVVWALFFAMFVRVPGMDRERNTWLNRGGAVALLVITALYRPVFGIDVSIRQSDIIILILAWMALTGTVAWWFSRRRLLVRLFLVALIALVQLSSAVEGSWCARLWQLTQAGWLFRWEFLKYLCIVLPGTLAGDTICDFLHESPAPGSRNQRQRLYTVLFALSLATLLGVVLWGLFAREAAWTVGLSLGLLLIAATTLRGMCDNDRTLYGRLLGATVCWLLLGLAAEPLEGGIKKDPATVSYFFVTSALALCVVQIALVGERSFRTDIRPLVACGANPMFAYTASGYLLAPLLTLTMLSGAVERMASLTPWCGFLRGVLFALLVVGLTWLFTRKNYYWKS